MRVTIDFLSSNYQEIITKEINHVSNVDFSSKEVIIVFESIDDVKNVLTFKKEIPLRLRCYDC